VAVKESLSSRLIPQGVQLSALSHHLDDCIYHPTTGLIAKQAYLPNLNLKKKTGIVKHPQVDYLTDLLKQRMIQLYPKTRKAREYIIENERINLDFVKPSKGYSIIDKLRIFIRK
jgi:hypothetical protein